jgi:hypothetical protein
VKKLLTYVRNGKAKRKAKVTPPIFDMVSSYYIYRQNPRSRFVVTSGKKEAEPKIICEGSRRIRLAKKVYDVDVCRLYVPIKGLLVSRNPKKPAVVYLDKRSRVLVISKVPTRWCTITIRLKVVLYGQSNTSIRGE